MQRSILADAFTAKGGEVVSLLDDLVAIAETTTAPPLLVARALVAVDAGRAEIDRARELLLPYVPQPPQKAT